MAPTDTMARGSVMVKFFLLGIETDLVAAFERSTSELCTHVDGVCSMMSQVDLKTDRGDLFYQQARDNIITEDAEVGHGIQKYDGVVEIRIGGILQMEFTGSPPGRQLALGVIEESPIEEEGDTSPLPPMSSFLHPFTFLKMLPTVAQWAKRYLF